MGHDYDYAKSMTGGDGDCLVLPPDGSFYLLLPDDWVVEVYIDLSLLREPMLVSSSLRAQLKS